MFGGRSNNAGIPMAEAGQHILGKTGGPGELGRILRKTLALYCVTLATFAAWAIIVLALGPALTGAAGLLYGAAWLYQSSQEAEHPPHWALVVGLEVMLLALALAWVTALAEPATVAWWPVPFSVRVDYVNRWWRLTFALIGVGWLSVRRHVAFRLQYEVSDSSYPGPIGRREGWQGPVGPDTEFLPPPALGAPETEVRTVDRPYPVWQNGRLVSDGVISDGVSDIQVAPSGREVSNAALRQFIRGSYRNGTAFINVWRPRGWEYSKWKDTVDLLHIFGVTSALVGRTKTRLLPPTQEDAMARLERNLN